MAVIQVDGLRKNYGRVEAVRGVSFEVARGEIFGMIGPNGAGKTTTIECCLGLRTPSDGTVRLLDLDPRHDRRELYRMVGAQLQETSYQPHIRVDEICKMFSSLYSHPVDWKELLGRFDLLDKATARVDALSGGQRQRLSIVLALIPNPQIVFLDELTTGLDPRARREMWEDVRTLRDQGVTIFMTTHYMEEAEYLCDRVAIINHGRIIALDTVQALVGNSRLDHEIGFSADSVDVTAIRGIEGVRDVTVAGSRVELRCTSQHVLAKLVALLERQDVDYRDVRTRSPGLEDVFLSLTDAEVDQ